MSSTTFGCLLVCLIVTIVHYADKNHHRKSLIMSRKLGDIGRTRSSLLINKMASDVAQTKLKGLQTLIVELDYTLPSSFHNLLNLERVIAKEKRIYEELWECSREELNFIVLNIEMRLLLYKVKNHNKATSLNDSGFISTNRSRSDILDLLSRHRVSDLSTSAKVVVIDTIQALRFTSHPDIGTEAETCIENIILKTRGDALSDLKVNHCIPCQSQSQSLDSH